MSRTNISVSTSNSPNSPAAVTISVESNRLSAEGSQLLFKFTDEGLIIDHISNDGEVLKTFGNMYDEIEDLLK